MNQVRYDKMHGTPQRRIVRRSAPWLALFLVVWTLPAGIAGEKRDRVSRPFEIEHDKAAEVAAQQGSEILHMRWKFGGVLGAIAGLFVPNSGDALLTYTPQQDERMQIQLLITAPKREGEYFLYGAEIDDSTGSTTAVWSSYTFRGRRTDEEQDVDEPDVIDFASAIHHMRSDPPRGLTRMTIWSGGKTYPVEVEPLKPQKRKIAGRKIDVRGYAIRGVKIEGEPSFDDKFTLYFARDNGSTPVEILGKRGMIRVRFELIDAESIRTDTETTSAHRGD